MKITKERSLAVILEDRRETKKHVSECVTDGQTRSLRSLGPKKI